MQLSSNVPHTPVPYYTEFVGNILADSEKIEGYKLLKKVSLSELVEKVSTYLDADKDEVLSGNRRQKNCHARGLISFVAAKSMGYNLNFARN